MDDRRSNAGIPRTLSAYLHWGWILGKKPPKGGLLNANDKPIIPLDAKSNICS